MTSSREYEKKFIEILEPHVIERILIKSVMLVFLLTFLIALAFCFFTNSYLANKSQVVSTILTFGAFIGAAFIPIWQYLVAGRFSRLERTISLWQAYRSDETFKSKREAARKHCDTVDHIKTLTTKVRDDDHDNLRAENRDKVRDFCNFYERLGRSVREMYYDKKEAKALFGKHLIKDYGIVELYIKHVRERQSNAYENFLWIVKECKDASLIDQS